MRIESVAAVPWPLPLVAQFSVARRTAYVAENVRIYVRGGGIAGMGGCVPVFYVTGETSESVLQAASDAARLLTGRDAGDIEDLLAAVAEACPSDPAARAGLEIALYDFWAKANGVALRPHFGGAATCLVTDMTIPIVDSAAAETEARALAAQGFHMLKIKVGDPAGLEADLARISGARRGAPGARLRLDANQGYTIDTASELIDRLEAGGYPIDLIEQPVPKSDIAGMKAVRAISPYPVFADESACSPYDVRTLIETGAVDGVVVKLMKSGLAGAVEILDICAAAGIKTMMGCMLESGLGIAAALAISLGRGAVEYADLDSHRLLAPVEGLHVPFACEGDSLTWTNDSPGWGVSLG